MYLTYRDAEQVAAELAASAHSDKRWLLCLADRHGDDGPALLAACDRLGLEVCGGIFPGLIEGSTGRDSGIVALPLPTNSRVALAYLDKDGLAWVAPPPNPDDTSFASSILLVDCLAPNIDGLMEQLYDLYGSRMHHIGAGAGYHDLRTAPVIFTREGLHPHAALMIALPQQLTLGIRHGWKRVAGPFVVSRSHGNVIQELDWEPAGSFFRNQVGLQAPELRDKPVFPDVNSIYPLCIAKEGSEDIMRDPMYITDANEVVVLSDVAENSVIYLAHGDRDTLIEAARQAVDDCGDPPAVERCFVSDCYSRVLKLGEDFNRELDTARRALRADVALEGVQALGEIAANGKQKLEFFNKTFVVGLLHPRQ
ncbi:MAG: FIST C-terminal domain-containing protein [Rhodocyclaceae bacterium]|nr:FIST C-terminal domain-containing protein [Rhodocyclaceae bacterium]